MSSGKRLARSSKLPKGDRSPGLSSDAIAIALLVALVMLQLVELAFPLARPIASLLQIAMVIGVMLRWRVLGSKSAKREKDIVRYYREELEEAKKQIRSFDITDQLTGLYTYQYLYNRLETEVDRARRYQHPLSVVIVDVAGFNDFNQKHGRLMAEAILKRFSVGVLRRVLRTTDLIGRYGGDQFIVMLTETPKDGAVVAASRLHDAASAGVLLPSGERIKLPILHGIATYPNDAVSADSLVRAADKDLGMAKEKERIKT